MAFIRANFGAIGGQSKAGLGGAPAMYSYKTDDSAATVDSADYFLALKDVLKVGDIIYRVTVTNLGASNEATSTYGPHLVNAVSSTSVDVSDATTGTVTDTD